MRRAAKIDANQPVERAEHELPPPISVNNLFVNTRGGRYTSPKYKAWKQQAAYMLMCSQPVAPPYAIGIRVPATWRGDIDNSAKAILDALQTAEVIDNDRNVERLSIEKDRETVNTKVTIETMEAA